jgi:hypothetical protein
LVLRYRSDRGFSPFHAEKRGGVWGLEFYNYFLALVEMITTSVHIFKAELVFLNVYGAQESIPRNEFRQP